MVSRDFSFISIAAFWILNIVISQVSNFIHMLTCSFSMCKFCAPKLLFQHHVPNSYWIQLERMSNCCSEKIDCKSTSRNLPLHRSFKTVSKMLVKLTPDHFWNNHDKNSSLAHQLYRTLHPSLLDNQKYNSPIVEKANDWTSGSAQLITRLVLDRFHDSSRVILLICLNLHSVLKAEKVCQSIWKCAKYKLLSLMARVLPPYGTSFATLWSEFCRLIACVLPPYVIFEAQYKVFMRQSRLAFVLYSSSLVMHFLNALVSLYQSIVFQV